MHIHLKNKTHIELPKPLSREVISQLRAIRTRKSLNRSDVYVQHRQQIKALTEAVAYGQATDISPSSRPSFLRIGSWNIERGRKLDLLIDAFKTHPELSQLDFILLCEVDAGMARSGNRFVAKELAKALNYHWVFGNSYVCLDHGDIRDGIQCEDNSIGMHGNAILSRYPLEAAYNCSLHITKDKFASSYEKRLGHKRALWTTAITPLGELTLAVAHLDAFASPYDRGTQADDLLKTLIHQKHMVFAGDLNTTTFAMGSMSQLLSNVMRMLSKGIGDVLHHYLHPYELYERPIFETFEAHNLSWRDFNNLAQETFRFDLNHPQRIAEMRDKLPNWIVQAIRSRVAPHGGVARGRLDWFTSRGLRALGDGECVEPSGRSSKAPRVVSVRGPHAEEISDHDLIIADVVLNDMSQELDKVSL